MRIFALSISAAFASLRVEEIAVSPFPMSIWTETPNRSLHDIEDWQKFYSRMASFVRGNRVGIEASEIILRVLNPTFSSNGTNLWADPSTSPMMTHLISTLENENVALQFYPYMGEDEDLAAWAGIADSGNPLEGVFVLAHRWNKALEQKGSPHRFKGIFLEIDEFPHHDFSFNRKNVNQWKDKYDIQTISIGIHYEDYHTFHKYESFVDYFYSGAFDLYTESAKRITLRPETSPFVQNPTNPLPVIEFIKNEVFHDPKVVEMYTRYGNKIILVWSVQNKGSTVCIYPLRGSCGHNYEAGTWGPDVAHSFFAEITAKKGIFENVAGHGIFEFDLIPNSWV